MADSTPRLGMDYLLEAQSQKHVTVNEALAKLDAFVSTSIKSITDTAPPGSPADGDVYYVPAGATGAWAGHDDEFTYYDTTWRFVDPFILVAWVEDILELRVYDGSTWLDITTAGGLGTAAVLDVDTDGTLAANSDAKIPTQQAVKEYAVTGPGSATVDSELALWSGTGSRTLKRASTTGLLKAAAGVLAAAVAGTDYYAPGSTDVAIADGGTGASTAGQANANLGVRQKNLAFNPVFEFAQNGTSYVLSSGVKSNIVDCWHGYRNAGGAIISRQTGFSGYAYCLRLEKNSGTNNASINVYMQIPSRIAKKMAGKKVSIGVEAQSHASWSGTSFNATMFYGTGDDETFSASSGFPTGGGNTTLFSAAVPSTTPARYTGNGVTMDASMTEACLRITAVQSTTAGSANDYMEITGIKLAIEDVATAYEPMTRDEMLGPILDQFRKSFEMETAPASSLGADKGQEIFRAQVGGAAVNRGPRVRFGRPMRITPSITFYNPRAAGSQARDVTMSAGAGGDCSSTTAGNITADGFGIVTTGNASTTAHTNDLEVHWTADARFP